MNKIFEAHVCVKGESGWKPVTYSGDRFYADEAGAGHLHEMAGMMAQVFPNNDYKIVETDIN